ncbi:hypothetical protein BC835DRAFT_1411873 [Cytidiella melzeri]|nr:hypothetical protein BC835DRAFT_1411873 [Cytidiella melzeri]
MAYAAVEESRDPLLRYLRDTSDADSANFMRSWRLNVTLTLEKGIRNDVAWTVGDADAAGHVDRYLDKLVDGIGHYVGTAASLLLLSNEQKRRQTEYIKKCDEVITRTLKDRKKDMICLAALSTRPSKQRRGYGSALVSVVTTQADKEERSAWLISSNRANTPFYNSLGFVAQADIILGEDDVTWSEPPVVMSLMVRAKDGL